MWRKVSEARNRKPKWYRGSVVGLPKRQQDNPSTPYEGTGARGGPNQKTGNCRGIREEISRERREDLRGKGLCIIAESYL